MKALDEFWEARSNQEKNLITIAFVVMLVAFVFAVAVEPAWLARSRLRAALPQLQQQIVHMQQQSQQAQRLTAQGQGTTLSGEPLRKALTDAARQRGLSTLAMRFEGGAIQSQGNGINFADWVAWLEDARRQYRVRVLEAHVIAQKDGLVDVRAALAVP